jgi:hypothetical protein
MSPPQSPVRTRSRSRSPALRLLHGQGPAHSESRGHDVPTRPLHVVDGPTRILLAGSDAGHRTALLDELTQTLSADTVFAEADAVCEVLEHAPGSRMAFITGDLDDAPAESLMHMLAHRHPELPVMIVDSPIRNSGEHVAARHGELHIQHA